MKLWNLLSASERQDILFDEQFPQGKAGRLSRMTWGSLPAGVRLIVENNFSRNPKWVANKTNQCLEKRTA